MKFYGKIGFVIAERNENDFTDWNNRVIEKGPFYGSVNNRRFALKSSSDSTVDDVTYSRQIDIIADNFTYKNRHFIKYIEEDGVKWKVDSVERNYPKLTLTIGGMYNGIS